MTQVEVLPRVKASGVVGSLRAVPSVLVDSRGVVVVGALLRIVRQVLRDHVQMGVVLAQIN